MQGSAVNREQHHVCSSHRGISVEVLPIQWSDFCWRKTPFDQMIHLLRGYFWFALVGAKAWAEQGNRAYGSWFLLVANWCGDGAHAGSGSKSGCGWASTSKENKPCRIWSDFTLLSVDECMCLQHLPWVRAASLASSGFGDIAMKAFWKGQRLWECLQLKGRPQVQKFSVRQAATVSNAVLRGGWKKCPFSWKSLN